MAVKKMEIYKCVLCGNIVEVLHPGMGSLVCCGKPMLLEGANTVDAAHEKHVPVIEKCEGGILVKVGAVDHPMIEKHYIEWVEVQHGDIIYRKDLNPGEKPHVFFAASGENIIVRAYCNLHGLWQA